MTIGLPVDCGALDPVSADYVKDFCGCEDYKANTVSQDLIERLKEREKEKIESRELIGNSLLMDAYPNPAKNNVEFKYYIERESNVNLFLTDVFGRVVMEIKKDIYQTNGEYSVSIDTYNIPQGIYFYTLRTQDYFESKKLVIVK